MYSGSDSNESQKYTQWMNPASYQGMSNEQVDWAALAQQWIIMKEAGPPPIPGEAPVVLNKKHKQKDDEAGEAPMDVENDKDEPAITPVWNEPPPPPGSEPWNWNSQTQNWNWNNSWIPPTAVPPPPTIGPMKTPLLPTPNNSFNAPPDSGNDNAVPFGNYSATGNNEFNNSHGGYWTSTGANANLNANTNATAATKHIKPHNKRYSKVNVPVRVSAPLPPATVPVIPAPTPAPPLDAAKRKQLPAWIREGLEKMEKDKLKELEKEKQKKEREEYIEKNKVKEQETMEILKTTMKERQKSKFESDGENSEDEPRRKRSPSPEHVVLTPDELMLKVRRTMTEILLNVTNRQIEAICKEELQRYTKKYKGSYQRSAAPSEGANISAKLGLGMYGEGSDSSSEDEEDENYKRSFRDSDDELKDVIKKKMVEFQKTEREIQDRLDEVERRKGGSVSRSTTPESNDNDSQVDARVQDDRYQEEKLSPVSSKNYEKSKNRSPSTDSDSSNYSSTKVKNSRRSSSSESNDSYKKTKSRHKSRSRSRSTDKHHRTSNRWSRSKSPARRESSSSKRDSVSSFKKKSSRRSRSRSYSSRSRRSRSSSYRRSKRSRSRDRYRRTRSRSSSRSRYSSSKSDRKRRRSRSDSSSRGKRSHRH